MKTPNEAPAVDPDYAQAERTLNALSNVGYEAGEALEDARKTVDRARVALAQAQAHERAIVDQLKKLQGAAEIAKSIADSKRYDTALKAALGKCKAANWPKLAKDGASNEQILKA